MVHTMKLKKVILAVVSMCISTAVYSADAPFYFGVGAGQTNISKNVNGDYKVASTATFSAGVTLSEGSSFTTSAFARYTQTLTKETSTVDSVIDEYKEESLGLFLSAKTSSDFYAKANLGVVNHRISTNTVVTYDKIKPSAGFGFGMTNDTGGVVELEYTIVGEDISYININYFF